MDFNKDKEKNTKKLYTEQELNAEVEKRLNEAKAGWDKENAEKICSERDDAAKMASMSADERARAEMEKKQKAFDEERNQYMSEKMEFEAAKELSKQKLPLTFAKILTGGDMDATIANIETFKEEFLKAIEDALAERLKGSVPKTGTIQKFNSDPFLNGFGG